MISIKTFVFNPFQENTIILFDDSNHCIIVDPGMNNETEEKELVSFINNNGLLPQAIVNTHCHVDHILGCVFLKEKYALPFYAHRLELRLIETAQEFGEFFGLKVKQPPVPDTFLEEGKDIILGESTLRVIHVPGHSEGSIALYSESYKFIITGDVLFYGSIGRTDLPGGNYNTLIRSIRGKIMVLPKDVAVFPGHGSNTTIQHEYDTNPFLN